MGLIVSIYKDKGQSYSNGGVSGAHDELTLVNVDGPFDPTPDRPAALLVHGNVAGHVKVVMATEVDGEYVPANPGGVGPMMGGCYVGAADSRLGEAVEVLIGTRCYGAVPLHDRFESQPLYDLLSN